MTSNRLHNCRSSSTVYYSSESMFLKKLTFNLNPISNPRSSSFKKASNTKLKESLLKGLLKSDKNQAVPRPSKGNISGTCYIIPIDKTRVELNTSLLKSEENQTCYNMNLENNRESIKNYCLSLVDDKTLSITCKELTK